MGECRIVIGGIAAALSATSEVWRGTATPTLGASTGFALARWRGGGGVWEPVQVAATGLLRAAR